MNKSIVIFKLITISVLILSACIQSEILKPTSTPSSGIEGYVTEGPICPGPVAVGSNSCPDQPYQATISILNADNKEVTRFQTDTAGYFKINLPPGTYTLHPESDKTLPHAADQTFTVTPDQYSQMTVIYDTGMR